MRADAPRPATRTDLERIAQSNRTEMTFPDNVTVQQLIEAAVDKHFVETAMICEHDKAFGAASLTYSELNHKVNQLAHLLRAKGVRPGQIVGLMTERSFAMIIGMLGIIKAGGAYLPISPENPTERTDYLLKDGGVKIALVHNKTNTRIAFGGLVINLDDREIYRGSTGNLSILNSPRD